MKVTIFHPRAAIFAASATAVTALTLPVAPTAHADDQWAGISMSPDGKYSAVTSKQPSSDAALKAAKSNCPQPECTVEWTFKGGCGAFSKAGNGASLSIGTGPTKDAAEKSALANGGPGSNIIASVCAGG